MGKRLTPSKLKVWVREVLYLSEARVSGVPEVGLFSEGMCM